MMHIAIAVFTYNYKETTNSANNAMLYGRSTAGWKKLNL